MNTLRKNEQKFYYATYVSKELVTKDGLYTGERSMTYSSPVEAWANISPARGDANTDQFGTNVDYDRVIVTCKDLPIDENSLIWIDADTKEPNDYVVRKVGKSLNVLSIAVKKVKVSDAS